MVAADVELSEGVLNHVGRLQQNLIELHVLSAGLGVDLGAVDGVGRGARLGLDAGALFIQLLRGDDDGIEGGEGCAIRRRGVIGCVGGRHD